MAELHFCTVCGVSVPQADVDSGRATVAGERSVCPDCFELLGVSGRGGSGGGSGAGWVALVVAVVAIGFATWSWRDVSAGQDHLRGATSDALEIQAGIYAGRLEDAITAMTTALDQESGLTQQGLEALGDRIGSLEEAMNLRLQSLQSETEQLGQLALEIEALGRRLGKSEAELTLATERLGEQRGVVTALRDRLDTLEATQRDLAQRGPVAGSEQPGEDNLSPAVAGLVRKLRSSDQDERLDALEKLSAQEDERLVPHLIPMLTDPYEFNRFYAAKTLGDWRSKPSTPHLIESLLDEIGFVRQAAVQSLCLITGQNFRFDHDGSENDRKQGYDAWKTWWNTNGKSFLEG